MDLEKIVAVSGLPGLYKLVSTRNSGLVVADMDTEKTRFCSSRKHQFTPLETVSIYTMSDSEELKKIFNTMLTQAPDNPVISASAPNSDIASYFASILPDYDPDKVYVSDMKKVIKWYNFLDERGYIKPLAAEEEE